MTDDKKSYRVTDRRQFTLEGEPVADAEREAEAAEPEPSRPDRAVGEPPPADFIGFILSLGAQASVLLGGTEGNEPDLKGAKWLISILEMLREKTEGRRTPEETEALDTILYELRLGYVKRAGAGGA